METCTVLYLCIFMQAQICDRYSVELNLKTLSCSQEAIQAHGMQVKNIIMSIRDNLKKDK